MELLRGKRREGEKRKRNKTQDRLYLPLRIQQFAPQIIGIQLVSHLLRLVQMPRELDEFLILVVGTVLRSDTERDTCASNQ